MRRFAVALILAAVLPMCGCFVSSVYPLASPHQAVFDPNLVGVWSGDEGKERLVITRAGDRLYDLTHIAEGRATLYTVQLVEIAKLRYFDVFVKAAIQRREEPHMVPTHSIWKIEAEPGVLRITPMSAGWIEGQLNAGTLGVHALEIEDDVMLLTSQTEQLQDFVRANDGELFPESRRSEWTRGLQAPQVLNPR